MADRYLTCEQRLALALEAAERRCDEELTTFYSRLLLEETMRANGDDAPESAPPEQAAAAPPIPYAMLSARTPRSVTGPPKKSWKEWERRRFELDDYDLL